jgi:aminopeptidase N
MRTSILRAPFTVGSFVTSLRSRSQEEAMWNSVSLVRARAAVVQGLSAMAMVTTLAAGTAWAADCPAGADGVGDPYYPLYGNGGYDVEHYLLQLTYDPATDVLVGEATIVARATTNLCRFNLDFQGMTVRSVAVDGRPAAWTRSADHELTLAPQQRLKNGRLFTTVVRYDGVPRTQFDLDNDPYGWIHTDDGAVVAGEPEGAINWFPVNDHPLDKASFTFVVKVPAGLTVVGNGWLLARATANNWTTWLWHAPEPMAPYLATVTLGRFNLRSYRTPGGLQMYDAVDPDLYTLPVDPQNASSPTFGQIADGALARQGEILDFLAGLFGPYPFSSGGGVVDDTPLMRFALENQTRSNYTHQFFINANAGESVVVHENAHQWFGDSVSVAEWQHIWLNEGFATYAEWLWSEAQGRATAQDYFNHYYNTLYPEADPFWAVTIGDPGTTDLFHRAVYRRGGMTLHALRGQVGDADFFRILRTWTARKAGGHGTTAEFIELAENISGQQLDELFQTWLFTPSRPAAGPAATAATSAASARVRTSAPPASLQEQLAERAELIRH